MKKTLFSLIAVLLCGFFACKNSQPAEPEKQISFDPNDTTLVDELMDFYILSEIVPKEAMNCQHSADTNHNFDCLSDNCFITNDLIDSTTNTFFVEVAFETGSSGNNNIYICKKDADGFKILYSTEGLIDPDLGPEEVVNGYKVLYIKSLDKQQRLVFNGSEFVLESIEDPQLAAKK